MSFKTTESHRNSQRRYRITHLEKQREAVRYWRDNGGRQRESERLQQIKAEVLTYYGNGKCACVFCGESRLACLSLDHINGNGNQERKHYGSTHFGAKLCRLLRRRGYPKGFQTLCMNCQFCKVVTDQSHAKLRKFPK